MQDFAAQFSSALRATGLEPPEEILFDDKIHRFSTNGKTHDDSGYYRVVVDNSKSKPFAFGFFGCWRDGLAGTWHCKSAEPEWVKKASKSLKRKQENETKKRNEQMAKKAQYIFENATQIKEQGEHPYLVEKGMRAPGGPIARIYKGTLCIAMRNANKEIRSLQFISCEGGKSSKRFLSGASTKALYCALGGLRPNAKNIYVAEGFSTADAVAQLTGGLCINAFSAANLMAVARIIQDKFPQHKMIIAGDAGEVGETKAHAAAAAVDGLVTIPPAAEQLSDWNDVLCERGADNGLALFESCLEEPSLVKKAQPAVEEYPTVAVAPEPEDVTPNPSPASELKQHGEMAPAPPIEEYEEGHDSEYMEDEAENWRGNLLLSPAKRGEPEKVIVCEHNATLFLMHHSDFTGCLAYNELSNSPCFTEYPYWYSKKQRHRETPFDFNDGDMTKILIQLQKLGMTIAHTKVFSVVVEACTERKIHPIRQVLNEITWDGTERIDNWLTVYLGAEDSELNRAYGRKFMIGAIARVYNPGSQVDSAIILEGEQGTKKSTLCRELAYGFFTDEHINMSGHSDGAMYLQGNWICELAELTALKRSDIEGVKAFITRRRDKIRPPFGRSNVDWPRQCVFIGTTNSVEYLSDSSGNRRFWPVKCGQADIDGIKRDRGQLWAEAKVAYENNEAWWLSDEMTAQSSISTESRTKDDAWRVFIEGYILKHDLQMVTAEEILVNVIMENDSNKANTKEWTNGRIGAVLRTMGWNNNRNVRLPKYLSPDKFGVRPRPFWHPTLDDDLGAGDMLHLKMHVDYRKEHYKTAGKITNIHTHEEEPEPDFR